MHTYNRANGNWSHGGVLLGVGYSGNGAGLDNPDMSAVHNVGPIPAGLWTIDDPYTDAEKGPLVMALVPGPETDTLGRGGFLIHGDNPAMDHTASEGCIVLAHEIRAAIAESGDNELTVV